MTTTDLKAIIADIVEQNVDLVYPNGPHVADLILQRIRETHFIMEKDPTIDHSDRYISEWPEAAQPNAVNPAAMDAIGKKIAATKAEASWQGQVDRQGGSFSDQEIADSYTWR